VFFPPYLFGVARPEVTVVRTSWCTGARPGHRARRGRVGFCGAWGIGSHDASVELRAAPGRPADHRHRAGRPTRPPWPLLRPLRFPRRRVSVWSWLNGERGSLRMGWVHPELSPSEEESLALPHYSDVHDVMWRAWARQRLTALPWWRLEFPGWITELRQRPVLPRKPPWRPTRCPVRSWSAVQTPRRELGGPAG